MAKTMYKIQAGAYSVKANAQKMVDRLVKSGVPAAIVKADGLMKVQCGAFSIKENADKRLAEVKKKGFSNVIMVTVPGTDPVPAPVKTGPDKVYDAMKPFIDSKTAHADFVKEFNKFIAEYNKAHGTKHGKIDESTAWCTEFVELAFYKTGFLNLIGYGKQAKNLYENAKKNGTWKAGHDDIKYGDVVIYQNSRGEPNHTEFALGLHDFVSGNYRGGVHKRHRNSLGSVKGRIRPKYPT